MSRVTEFPEEESRAEREPIRLPKVAPWRRVVEFYNDVKLELSKTSWPTRSEVFNTTIVVSVAVIFFGFYLWGVDWLITLGFNYLEKLIR
jgi:preprotein translocase subunit SecE